MPISPPSAANLPTSTSNITRRFAAEYFPYHLAIGTDLNILSVGNSLKKIQPLLIPSLPFNEVAEFHHHCVLHSFNDLVESMGHRVTLSVDMEGVHLRGGFEFIDSTDVVYFIGYPVFANFDLAKTMGLEPEEFALDEKLIANSKMVSEQVIRRAEMVVIDNLKGFGDIYIRFSKQGTIFNIICHDPSYFSQSIDKLRQLNMFDWQPEAREAVVKIELQEGNLCMAQYDFIVVAGTKTRHFSARVVRTSRSGYMLIAREITARKNAKARLNYLANHDELTGLSNRRSFHTSLREQIDLLREERKKFALLLIDLDDFKHINDTYGHKAGDRVLVESAKRLRACLRENDIAARIGGDEFGFILPEFSAEQAIEKLAERFIRALDPPFLEQGTKVSIGITIGMVIPNPEDTLDEIMRSADLAMYEAKDLGKNRYVWFSPELRLRHVESKKLKSSLQRAIANREFTISYQPIFNLQNSKVHAFEALARWHHTELGWIRPDIFIKAAEDFDLIYELSTVLFDIVCTDMAWINQQMDQINDFRVHYNVSTKELNRSGLAERMVSSMSRHHLIPETITLELTESALLDQFETANDELNQLKKTGMSVALDDFGKGYSSLSYLARLPVDIVKIDKSFINAMGEKNNKVGAALIGAIVGLQESLGVGVVAEGIETEAQRKLLTELGCAYGQGYLFARPSDRATMLNWLQGN